VDENLATGSSPESGGQWLHVQMEINDEWCPTGSGAGADTLQYLIIEWPGLKRTTMIIEFQSPCCVQGHQPPDQAAQNHIQPPGMGHPQPPWATCSSATPSSIRINNKNQIIKSHQNKNQLERVCTQNEIENVWCLGVYAAHCRLPCVDFTNKSCLPARSMVKRMP